MAGQQVSFSPKTSLGTRMKSSSTASAVLLTGFWPQNLQHAPDGLFARQIRSLETSYFTRLKDSAPVLRGASHSVWPAFKPYPIPTPRYRNAGRSTLGDVRSAPRALLLPCTFLVPIRLEALAAFVFRHLQTAFFLKITHGRGRISTGNFWVGVADE